MSAATKKCTKCKKNLSHGLFYKNRHKADGLNTHCRACERARMEKWKKENPKKYRMYWIFHLYGLTSADYGRMLKRQKGVCAICRKPEKRRALSVDHDHATGRVRGLLCTKCNTGVGMLSTVRLLTSAVRYLK